MNWLEKLRAKPHEQKVKIITVTAVITAILLIVLWVLTANWDAHRDKDTSIFQTISRGIRDLKK